MPYIIELIDYKKDYTNYIHDLWADLGVKYTIISIVNDKTPVQPYEVRMPCLNMHSTPDEVAHILQACFHIPHRISKMPLVCKNIVRFPRLIVNSIILQRTIKRLQKQNQTANAIIYHTAYGTEHPYFIDKKKTFFYLHSTISKTWIWARPKNQNRTRKIFKHKNIIACSKKSMQDFQDLHINYNSLAYATNGVPVQALQHHATQPLPLKYQNIPYITTVCRLSPEKQIPEMIEAFVRADINCTFIIVGEGEHRPQIEQKIQDLHCQDKVILYGFDTNPARWFKNAIFNVVFSTYEGAPRSIPESLCLQTPVIVSDQITSEYLDEIPTPYIIPYRDMHALSRAMQHLYKNPYTPPPHILQKWDLKHQIKQQYDIISDSLYSDSKN